MPPSIRETREARGGTDRDSRTNRGDFVHYYDDLGISTTEEGYKGWKDNQVAYGKSKAKSQAAIKTEEANYAKSKAGHLSNLAIHERDKANFAKAQATHNSALRDGWRKVESSFIPVRLVDKNNNILGHYRLPRASTDDLNNRMGNNANYVDGGRNFNVVDTGGVAGVLDTVTRNNYNQYVKQSQPALRASEQGLADAQSRLNQTAAQLNTNTGQLQGYRGQIDNANKQIVDTDAERARQMAEIRGAYAKKLETLRGIFGGSK